MNDTVKKNLRLRPIEREDLPLFVKWLGDPEVLEFLGIFNPLSQSREEKWYDKILEGSIEEHPFAIEILEKGTWRMIGNIAFFDVHKTFRSAEVGIMIGDKTAWSKGYGTEAMRQMVAHGFNDLNLHRIHLQVIAENIRGIRCYEKVGFIKEGCQRDDCWKSGKFHDVYRMSILFPEWEKARRGD